MLYSISLSDGGPRVRMEALGAVEAARRRRAGLGFLVMIIFIIINIIVNIIINIIIHIIIHITIIHIVTTY